MEGTGDLSLGSRPKAEVLSASWRWHSAGLQHFTEVNWHEESGTEKLVAWEWNLKQNLWDPRTQKVWEKKMQLRVPEGDTHGEAEWKEVLGRDGAKNSFRWVLAFTAMVCKRQGYLLEVDTSATQVPVCCYYCLELLCIFHFVWFVSPPPKNSLVWKQEKPCHTLPQRLIWPASQMWGILTANRGPYRLLH